MDRTIHDPVVGVYPSGGDYAHAIELRGIERLVYLAGTMGLDPDGRPGADLDEQLTLIWNNIRNILAAADMTVDNIVRITSYVRDVAYAGPNAAARIAALGGRAIPTTAIVAQTLETEWLVELEVIAAA
jgi:enamine deaminase RidA (YjgF/YER057c/UK114 family)